MLAVRLRQRENRTDVAAHAYGNNVPAILAYTLTIMLPVYLQSHDINRAWAIGAAAVIWTGIIKLAAVPFAGIIRRVIPVPASMAVFGAAMYSYLGLALLQRLFDQPIVGLVALTIVAVFVLGNIPITRFRIPPFLVAWLLPLAIASGNSLCASRLARIRFSVAFAGTSGALGALKMAVPYMSVIAPIAIYQVLQDIAAVEGAVGAGDNYDVRCRSCATPSGRLRAASAAAW